MNGQVVDTAAELLFGCVDDFTRVGLRIGWYAIRGVLGSGGGGQSSKYEMIEAQLNKMVQAGDFSGARNLVEALDLDYYARDKVNRQLDEMEREWMRMAEWNATLNRYLQRGDSSGAIDYVNSLDLPYDRRQEICKQIRDVASRQEERRRQAEVWARELGELLNQRKYRRARKYVKSMPIEKEAKEKLLARLPKTSWLFG